MPWKSYGFPTRLLLCTKTQLGALIEFQKVKFSSQAVFEMRSRPKVPKSFTFI